MLLKLLPFALITTGLFADIVNISPPSLDFSNQFVGSQSSLLVVLSNPTKKLLNIASITTTGSFFVPENSCGGTVAPGAQCTFAVTFAPAAAGAQTGILSVNDDANDTPQKVKLSGTGVAVVLTSIAVTPANFIVSLGFGWQFAATGTYNNGSSQDLTRTATWSSGSPSVAIVNSTGLASTLAQGRAVITASVGGVTGSASLTVGPPLLVSMSVSPASANVKKGATLQLAAAGLYSDGSSADLTSFSQWSSFAPTVATVSSGGLASALAPGTATIQAASANLNATSTITVSQPVPSILSVAPTSFFLAPATSEQFTCIVTYDDGSIVDGTSSVAWNSSSAGVCSVNTSGLAACNDLGTVTITAELFGHIGTARLDSPVTGPRNNMSSRRFLHTATLLPDGRVLVAGGFAGNFSSVVATADLFDPSTRTFGSAGSMTSPRSYHTATLLPNGQVLIAGGVSDTAELSSAELYHPATGLFTPTGSLSAPRSGHTATLLPNGTVLIAGGNVLTAELYDPVTSTFMTTGGMTVQRYKGTATLLSNGKILFTGGKGIAYTATAELFDPSTGVFSGTGSMSAARAYHTALLLNNGTVFIAGGFNGTVSMSSSEIYDPASGVFLSAGSMFTARDAHGATLLSSGKVLISGGENQSGTLSSGEIFDPVSNTFVTPGILGSPIDLHYAGPGIGHTAVLLGSGQVLIAGGFGQAGALLSTELFVPQQ